MNFATVTSKLQFTIPAEIGRSLEIKPGDIVSVSARDDNRIVIQLLPEAVDYVSFPAAVPSRGGIRIGKRGLAQLKVKAGDTVVVTVSRKEATRV